MWVVFILKLQVPVKANNKKHLLPRTNMHVIKLLDTLSAPWNMWEDASACMQSEAF